MDIRFAYPQDPSVYVSVVAYRISRYSLDAVALELSISVTAKMISITESIQFNYLIGRNHRRRVSQSIESKFLWPLRTTFFDAFLFGLNFVCEFSAFNTRNTLSTN